MRVEVKRRVPKMVEEVIGVELNKYWLVRIIQSKKSGCKECVGEKEFLYKPDEQEIASFLYEHVLQYDVIFATVEENYRLEKIDKEGKITC